jgi:hypothetical protein
MIVTAVAIEGFLRRLLRDLLDAWSRHRGGVWNREQKNVRL